MEEFMKFNTKKIIANHSIKKSWWFSDYGNTSKITLAFKNIKMYLKLTLLVLTILAVSCTQWGDHYLPDSTDSKDIFEILKQKPECKEFVDAAVASGFDKVLSGMDIYTVLIPPAGTLNSISDPGTLKETVANHIIFGRYFSETWSDSLQLRSLSGKYFRILKNNLDNVVISNNKKQVEFTQTIVNLEARNGAAHSISSVLEIVPSLADLILNLNPDKYSIFLDNYKKLDSIQPDMYEYKLGINENGEVVMDTLPFMVHATFNPEKEDEDFTLIVPSNEKILEQKQQLLALNGGINEKISPLFYNRLIRNQIILGGYSKNLLLNSDTLITKGNQWVVGRKIKNDELISEKVASNGFLHEAEKIIYKPIAADFIDSIVYEAEWSMGFGNNEKTFISYLENEPIISGDGVNINYHFYAFGLNRFNRFNILVPNVFKGFYEVKLVFKPSAITIKMESEGKLINEEINMNTLVPVDPNNTDPNFFANARAGLVYLPEDGYLDLGFTVQAGIFSTLILDKIVLIPLEN